MNELPKAAGRVQKAANALGLPITVVEMAESTRTVVEAAAAVGCPAGAIVKSLVFMGRQTGRPYLLLVSGSNMVDTATAAAAVGEPLMRADARFVRTVTGYAIGGIPPIGHLRATSTWLDEDLLRFDTVWAAAGTHNAVFSVDPKALRDATGATVIAMKPASNPEPPAT
jgi:prolyl-tRNA editing enzyme YbaK/EbsC (Cys-tRNA(Pro) deacylase)